jgi:TRAP-type C4-dicarboxylate transport system substrate-binding protein
MKTQRVTTNAVVAAAVLILGVAPTGASAQQQYKMNLADAYAPTEFINQNMAKWGDEIRAATNGAVQINMHYTGSLIKNPEIKRAVQTGQVAIGELLMSNVENEEAIFGIDTVPFLATSYDESVKLWAASKDIIQRKMVAQGMTILFVVPWPPQGIYAKKDINTIADMKGLKFRAYNPATSRIAELVGAQPVTIQAAELPQALATGVVNAFMTSGSTGYDSKAWETMTHFYDTQAWIPKNVTFVNKAAFDALDKDTQAAILKAAALAEPWLRHSSRFAEQSARTCKNLPRDAVAGRNKWVGPRRRRGDPLKKETASRGASRAGLCSDNSRGRPRTAPGRSHAGGRRVEVREGLVRRPSPVRECAHPRRFYR